MTDIIASDKRTGIRESIQQTIVGDMITLIEVDCSSFGGESYRFHNHAINHVKAGKDEYVPAKVKYRGNEYTPYPYGFSGITYDSAQAPSPTLVLSNADNLISALCIRYDNLLNAKVTLYTTMMEYLDDGEYPSPDEHFKSVWYIANKEGETSREVGFKLTSPADVEGDGVPTRIISTHCSWALRGWYRSGKGCGYMGAKMFDKDDKPTTDPSKDVCRGLLKSCELRFGKQPLDFGGFPSASMIGGYD